ncbi:unnamed protein product [Rotaria magnacalcarata]|uniref:Glutathione S-transferase omega n=1 Tax=Rotaria magnacalcarata TaxID=392030 RepID=A0A8S2MNX3_9BILA|nr:unnamed protein product [Rotaria magnacalcarata]
MTTGQKHLKSDSVCPPLEENQLRLYSMRFCPFVRRAKLVLAAKNIPYEEVLINLNDEPEWYKKKNPSEEVPLLEWIDSNSKETRSIPQSLIICNYLDDLHPEHLLHPTDPYAKAKQQILTDNFGNVNKTLFSYILTSYFSRLFVGSNTFLPIIVAKRPETC